MTDKISVRRVDGDEMLDILYWLDNYAFHPTPPFPEREEWEGLMKTREGTPYYAVFEGDKGWRLRPAQGLPKTCAVRFTRWGDLQMSAPIRKPGAKGIPER